MILLLLAGCSAADPVDPEPEAERIYRRIREVFHETPIVAMTFRTSTVYAESEWQSRGEPGTVFLKGDLIRIVTGGNGGMAHFSFTSNGKRARQILKEWGEPAFLDPPRDLPRTVKDDLLLGRVGDLRRLRDLCGPGHPGSPHRRLQASGFVLGRDLCDRPTLTYDITRPVEGGGVQSRVMLTFAPQTFSLVQIESVQCMGTPWFRTLFVTHSSAAMPEEAFDVED